jgi:hypothetical protein
MIKIEKVDFKDRKRSGPLREFVVALDKLQVGQSFLYKDFSAYHRNALSVVMYLVDKRFITRSEGDSRRIMRVE